MKRLDDIANRIYNIIVTGNGRKGARMEKGMTDYQYKNFLKTLLHILENEDKDKAIELIKSLLEK